MVAATEEASEKFVFEKAEMGVPFRITLYAADEAKAKRVAEDGFARVEALNRIFSDYEDDTELVSLSHTSGQGRAVKVSDELWTVLERAQVLAARTDGAFDVTCGPLTSMWRRARRKREMPAPDLVAEMASRVGWKKMRLDVKAHTVELLAPDMRLDVGSIGKGYACDEALKVLRREGCPRAMVAGSGDISAGDPPPGRKGWRIEIVGLDLDDPASAPAPEVVEIANAAVATSGDRNQRLDANGKRYSHILDPRTGQPLTDHALVSVIAKDGLTAGISTACSVIGPREALKLAAEWHAAIRIQRMPGDKVEITESPNWAALVVEREKK
ncbi:MAG: FAD:protein FMN transferase [Chthoniobacteraceae bacterium]